MIMNTSRLKLTPMLKAEKLHTPKIVNILKLSPSFTFLFPSWSSSWVFHLEVQVEFSALQGVHASWNNWEGNFEPITKPCNPEIYFYLESWHDGDRNLPHVSNWNELRTLWRRNSHWVEQFCSHCRSKAKELEFLQTNFLFWVHSWQSIFMFSISIERTPWSNCSDNTVDAREHFAHNNLRQVSNETGICTYVVIE